MTAVQSIALTLDEVATLPLDRVLVSAALRDRDGGLDGVGALGAKLAAAVVDSRIAVFGLAARQLKEAERAVAAVPEQGESRLLLAHSDTLAGLLQNLAGSAVPLVFGEQPQEVPWMGPADDWVLAWPGWMQWLRARLNAPREVGTVTLLVGSAGLGKSVWARQWIKASKGHRAGATLGHDAWEGLPSLTSWLLVDDLRLDRDRKGRHAMQALAARARRRMQHTMGAPAADASAHDICLSAWQSAPRGQAAVSVWLVDGMQSLSEDGWRGSIPCPPAGVHLVLLGRPATRLETLLRDSGDSSQWAATVQLDAHPEWLQEGVERYLAQWIQQAALDSELQQVLTERRPALLNLSEQRLGRLAALRRQVEQQPVGSQVPYVANAGGSVMVDASAAFALQGLGPELAQALQAAALAPVAVGDLALIALQLSGATSPLTRVPELAIYMDRDGSSVAQPWRGRLLAEVSDAWKRSLHEAWSNWCHKRPPGDRHRLWWAWHAMQAGQIECLDTLTDPAWWQRTFFQDKALESAGRLRAAQATAMAWSRAATADQGLDRVLVRGLWAQLVDRWGSALVMGHLDAAAGWPAPPHVGVLWMGERQLAMASNDEHRWILTSKAPGALCLHWLDGVVRSQETSTVDLVPPDGWQVAARDPSAHVWVDGNLLRVAALLQRTDQSGERALGTWTVSFDGRAGSSTTEPLPHRSTRMLWVDAAEMVGCALADTQGMHIWRKMTGNTDKAATITVPWPPLFDSHAVQLALGAVGETIVVAAADASGRLCCAAWPAAVDGVAWTCLQDTSAGAALSALVVTGGPPEKHAALVGWAQERTVQWAELQLRDGDWADVLPCEPFCAQSPVTALAMAPAPDSGWLLALGDQAGTVHWGHWPGHGGLADAAEAVSPLSADGEAATEDHAVRELVICTASRTRPESGHRLTHWIARRSDGDVAWGAWAVNQPDPALSGRTWAGDGLMGTILGIGQDGTPHAMALATRLEQGRHAVCWIATAPQDGPLPVVRQGRAAAALKREATIWSCACKDDGDHAVALVGFGKAPLFVQSTVSVSARPREHTLWNRAMPLVCCALADDWGWLVISINGLDALDLSWEIRGGAGCKRLSLGKVSQLVACPALAASVDAQSKLHLWLVTSDGSLFTWSCKIDRLCDDLPWQRRLPAGCHPRVSHLKVWGHANAADGRTDWLTVNDAGEIEVGQWRAEPDAGLFLCVRRSGLGPGDVPVVDGAVAATYSAGGTLDGVAWLSATGQLHATGCSGGITRQVAVRPAQAVQTVHEMLGLVGEVVASQPRRAGEPVRLWVLGAQSEAVAQLTLVGTAWHLDRMHLHRTRHGLGSPRLAAAGANACRLIYTQGPGMDLVSIPVI